MNKFYLSLAVFTLVSVWFVFGGGVAAQVDESAPEAPFVSPHLVISQFQVLGGNQQDEFIELHNIGAASVDLNGYRVVYRSAAGVNDVAMVEWNVSTVIPAGGFYLISSGASYDGPVPAQISYNTSMVSVSASGGGIGMRSGPLNTGALIDSVGYGSATNIFVEGAVAALPTANNSQARKLNGCQDTDINSYDFAATIPSTPRNTATTPVVCGGGGTTLFAAINANPSTVFPPGSVLLTVTVIPATTPPSTGISVIGNLSEFGGRVSQPFFDNGANGDATPGDNVFSFTVTIAAGTPGGSRSVTAVASDAQARTVNLTQSITINAPLPNEDFLIFGNPSNATADVINENNYLMLKPQYSLSYNRSKATPNWTAWRLDSGWIGNTPRQDDFRPDDTLPSGWYRVVPEDYSEPIYDRGHMCPSGDRTNSIPNNSATFLMTNMVPQLPANNQGPWEDFEVYLRTLAGQGREIYIISGPTGNIGTIGATQQNRVVIPSATWKVVIILANGANDLGRVSRTTRAFGIIVPNQPPLNMNDPWRPYRVTVDAVENLTGYNFFSEIPKNTQELMERRRDTL